MGYLDRTLLIREASNQLILGLVIFHPETARQTGVLARNTWGEYIHVVLER